ncbi:MAG: methyltransferase domain-containing protein [Planctomycetota bacterium]
MRSTPSNGGPMCVQYGCGLYACAGWVNYDASPVLKLRGLPLVGPIFAAVVPGPKFERDVLYGDVRGKLPVRDGSVDYLYCSHVLEHLTFADCELALRESFRVLRPSGVFRVVLPDLLLIAREYVESGEDEAAHRFMKGTQLGVKAREPGLMGLIRPVFGNSKHMWMWDEKSLTRALTDAGFTGVRRAGYRDSGISEFESVEREDRWKLALGLQCTKAAA